MVKRNRAFQRDSLCRYDRWTPALNTCSQPFSRGRGGSELDSKLRAVGDNREYAGGLTLELKGSKLVIFQPFFPVSTDFPGGCSSKGKDKYIHASEGSSSGPLLISFAWFHFICVMYYRMCSIRYMRPERAIKGAVEVAAEKKRFSTRDKAERSCLLRKRHMSCGFLRDNHRWRKLSVLSSGKTPAQFVAQTFTSARKTN